jgi:hypothetical protein
MKHKSPINNIVHSIINPDINVLYSPAGSAFDSIIYDLNINTHLFSSDYYYYDMYITNNCLDYTDSTKNIHQMLHLKDMVFLHSAPPKKLKKEDIVLLSGMLKNTHKIFLHREIANDWSASPGAKSHIINYGIPNPVTNDLTDKNKNVLVINTDNNSQISSMFRHISATFPNSDTMSSIPLSLAELYKTLGQYKVVIDINKTINCLCAIANGCKVITSAPNLDVQLVNIEIISDYSNILATIQKLLLSSVTEGEILHNQQILTNNYSYGLFQDKILEVLNNIKTKEIYKI